MEFLFTGVFWGVVLVLIGLSVIFKTFFHINIPVFRILLALFFIFLGVRILTGFPRAVRSDKGTILFSDSRVETPDQKEYNTIFGRAEFRLPAGETPVREINTVFGETILRLSRDAAVKVVCDAVFAGAKFPDGTLLSFGSYTWRSAGLDESKPHLVLKTGVVFGSFRVELE